MYIKSQHISAVLQLHNKIHAHAVYLSTIIDVNNSNFKKKTKYYRPLIFELSTFHSTVDQGPLKAITIHLQTISGSLSYIQSNSGILLIGILGSDHLIRHCCDRQVSVTTMAYPISRILIK